MLHHRISSWALNNAFYSFPLSRYGSLNAINTTFKQCMQAFKSALSTLLGMAKVSTQCYVDAMHWCMK